MLVKQFLYTPLPAGPPLRVRGPAVMGCGGGRVSDSSRIGTGGALPVQSNSLIQAILLIRGELNQMVYKVGGIFLGKRIDGRK